MPTYSLYIKTHSATGLKYLGQTINNPFKYRGSGIAWNDHLRIYGKKVITEVLLKTNDWEVLKHYAIHYSKLYKVDSAMDDYGNKIWANIHKEYGGHLIDRDDFFDHEDEPVRLRPLCKVCGRNARAPAYYRNGQRYYRSKCAQCRAAGRSEAVPRPKWQLGGYKKKAVCDLCGFKSRYASQIVVYHRDGDLANCELINLRSVCLNCVEAIKRQQPLWRQGDLEPD